MFQNQLTVLGLLAVFAFLVNPLLADKKNDKDKDQIYVVTTTNGKVYSGTIIERNEKAIVIKTSDGKRTIPLDEIEEIKKGKEKGKGAEKERIYRPLNVAA